jgi:hypothetical protein
MSKKMIWPQDASRSIFWQDRYAIITLNVIWTIFLFDWNFHLRHHIDRSWTINDGSAIKVVYRLRWWVWMWCVARRCVTWLRIGLSKINSVRRRRMIHIRIYKFFSSRSFINLRINSTLLFTYLSNVKLIMDWTSLRETRGQTVPQVLSQLCRWWSVLHLFGR